MSVPSHVSFPLAIYDLYPPGLDAPCAAASLTAKSNSLSESNHPKVGCFTFDMSAKSRVQCVKLEYVSTPHHFDPPMPHSSHERNQRRLQTFRIAYRNLQRSVRNVIRMQLGDTAYLQEERQRAARLLDASRLVRLTRYTDN